MTGEVLVLVHHHAADQDDLAAIEEAYDLVSQRLAAVPGLLGNELLHSPLDPTSVVVASRWADLAAFQTWERGADHRADTAPLRPYRDTRLDRPFTILQVRAAY